MGRFPYRGFFEGLGFGVSSTGLLEGLGAEKNPEELEAPIGPKA